MRWGHRRFRNEDGTLTDAGRIRYGVGPALKGGSQTIKKHSSGIRRLDASNATNKALANKNKIEEKLGKPTDDETSNFLKDVKAKGKGFTIEELEGSLGNKKISDASDSESKKIDDLIEEKGLAIYDPNRGMVVRKELNTTSSNPDDDYEEVDDTPGGSLAKPVVTIAGKGRSSREEKRGKVVDVDYEEVKDEPKKSSSEEKKETSAKEEKKESAKIVSETKPEKTGMTKEERDERRKSLALKGAATKTLTNEGKNIIDNANTVYSNLKKTRRMNSIDYSKLSNDDLKQRTERLNLERNYREAVGNNVNNHERRVNAFLSTAGSALAVTGSAIGIAIAIKQLRNG